MGSFWALLGDPGGPRGASGGSWGTLGEAPGAPRRGPEAHGALLGRPRELPGRVRRLTGHSWGGPGSSRWGSGGSQGTLGEIPGAPGEAPKRSGGRFLHTLPQLLFKNSVFAWRVRIWVSAQVHTLHAKTLFLNKSCGRVCKNRAPATLGTRKIIEKCRTFIKFQCAHICVITLLP